MRALLIALVIGLFVPAASPAAVVNVEFKFTPFRGNPAKEDSVRTVAGTAHVYLNGVPFADEEISESSVPVMFEAREIAPSVWVPAASCGPALRKGKNTIRIDFEPADAGLAYRAQLRWASVLDESSEQSEGGRTSATNQAGEGVDEKAGKGTLRMERDFVADFAADLPWHHYPPVAMLSSADKGALAALVAERLKAFQPDFSKLYEILQGKEGIDVEQVKSSKCLDQAYQAGARIAAPPPEKMEFVTTGGPEVVIRAQGGMLFAPEDMSAFDRIKDDDVQMCVGVVLSAAYPPRLVVVRAPSGNWEVAY